MKCSKCNFITFDFYDNCPKCNNDFTLLKRELNIIDYSIDKDNNYLIMIDEEEINFNRKTKEKIYEETFKEENNNTIPAITNSYEKKQEEEDIDGISLEELLETTKLEEE